MATSSAPQQGGASIPSQQQGQSSPKPTQPGQPAPSKPVLGDWASI